MWQKVLQKCVQGSITFCIDYYTMWRYMLFGEPCHCKGSSKLPGTQSGFLRRDNWIDLVCKEKK